MSFLGLVGIFAAAWVLDPDTPFPGYAVVLPVAGAALAVAGGTVAPGGGAEWLLRYAPSQWMGRLPVLR